MIDSNNKTSLLVNDQLPAFVREEHETFIKFMEYYYKSLEQDGQSLYVAKNFANYLNIDIINEHILEAHNPGGEREYYDYHAFLQKMYNTFIKYVPDNVLTDRINLVKHAKEFYRSTGSEKSVRFLIQALFNKEATFYYPKTDILRASDGKWFIEKSLKVASVEVNNVANSIAVSNFANTTIKGVTSNATAIVERVDTYYDKGVLVYELKLSNISREFENFEKIYTYYTEEGIDYYLTGTLFGSGVITYVQIVRGGAGYTEGTTIPIVSNVGSGGQVIVSKVSKGSIQGLGVIDGGAGFKLNDNLVISGSGVGAAGHVSDVDDSGFYHPNSYNVMWTTIGLEASTNIGNLIYSNLNSKIIDPANDSAGITNSMSYFIYANCGPVYSCAVDAGGNNYSPPLTITVSANSIISKLGILGKMKIVNGGTGYVIGDWINIENTYGSAGAGAIANVTNVAANGMITEIKFQQIPGHPVGGSGYDWYRLPSANVKSATGSGANIAVTAIIGHNEDITQSVSNIGTIQTLTVISGGANYTDNPTLNFSGIGDGNANAVLTTITGVFSYPGRYIADDGHISSYNFLENRDYYQEFSYVVRVDETINKYRAAVNDLVHPAGTKLFGEYTLSFDEETATNTNITVSYANTAVREKPYKTHYQVQGYTPGIFAPNVVIGTANSEFIAGTYSMNVTYHTTSYIAQNNNILVYYPSHSFSANSNVYLNFFGSGAWSNLQTKIYTITSANTEYFTVYNSLNVANVGGTVGSVNVYKPDVMIAIPYSRPSVGENVYIQFKSTDPSLVNTFYQVTGTMGVNTFNVLHPDMSVANTPNGIANVITKKIVVTANNHEYSVGENTYIIFSGDPALVANVRNGYYTVVDVGSANTFNISGDKIIFANNNVSSLTAETHQKRSKVVINNHPYANGTNVYIAFVDGDQGNTVNGVYSAVKFGANEFLVNVALPAASNSNVRVWYQTNNYSNIVFTTLKPTNGYSATDNVNIEFFASSIDLANGIYMVSNTYNSNTFNIYYNSNTYIKYTSIQTGTYYQDAVIHAPIGNLYYSNTNTAYQKVLSNTSSETQLYEILSIDVVDPGINVQGGWITFSGGSGANANAEALSIDQVFLDSNTKSNSNVVTIAPNSYFSLQEANLVNGSIFTIYSLGTVGVPEISVGPSYAVKNATPKSFQIADASNTSITKSLINVYGIHIRTANTINASKIFAAGIYNRGGGYFLGDNVTATIYSPNAVSNAVFKVTLGPDGNTVFKTVTHSGLGIVANSVMEGTAYVSPYK